MGAIDGSRGLMDASDRLVLNVEVARIFGVLGYERKAAFYLRQVAQLYQHQDSFWAATSALQVLTLTARTYRIQSKAVNSAKVNTLLDVSTEAVGNCFVILDSWSLLIVSLAHGMNCSPHSAVSVAKERNSAKAEFS